MTYRERLAKQAARARAYRARFPERKQAQNRRYYENNLETCKRATRLWGKLNLPFRVIQARARRKGLPIPTCADLRAQGVKGLLES